MPTELLIPCFVADSKQVGGSWATAQLAVEHGYTPGIMIVVLGGPDSLVGETAEEQREHLLPLRGVYRDTTVVVMLSWWPISEIDFFHNTKKAVAHVKAGVDFARSLPIGGRLVVTFHLSTLLTQQEMVTYAGQFEDIFEARIVPALKEVVRYAREKGVDLAIETVPDPEFGDLPYENPRRYQSVPLRDLRNPYPVALNALHCSFGRLRELGFGVCFDVCHHRVLMQRWHNEDWQGALLHEAQQLLKGDIIHLNDGAGRFTEEGGCFEEGVGLGEGDIDVLPDIIDHANEQDIIMVLETNEPSGDWVRRPRARRSIGYLGRI